MAQKAIFNEGIRRLKELDLSKYRLDFKLKNMSNDSTNNELIEKSLELVPKEYKLESMEKKVFLKETSEGFTMKWHCDDCAIFRHNKNRTYDHKTNIQLDDKYTLYHDKLPVYTMIIYLSEYGKEFIGGEFNFVDKKILPEKFRVILFDSREIHKVDMVKQGNRKCILIKFYQKHT